jgi:hypothetical protein
LGKDDIVTTFQDIDSALCKPPCTSYKAVLRDVVEEFGRRFNFPVESADRDVLAR